MTNKEPARNPIVAVVMFLVGCLIISTGTSLMRSLVGMFLAHLPIAKVLCMIGGEIIVALLGIQMFKLSLRIGGLTEANPTAQHMTQPPIRVRRVSLEQIRATNTVCMVGFIVCLLIAFAVGGWQMPIEKARLRVIGWALVAGWSQWRLAKAKAAREWQKRRSIDVASGRRVG